jgi:DNA primase catalytic subunit
MKYEDTLHELAKDLMLDIDIAHNMHNELCLYDYYVTHLEILSKEEKKKIQAILTLFENLN